MQRKSLAIMVGVLLVIVLSAFISADYICTVPVDVSHVIDTSASIPNQTLTAVKSGASMFIDMFDPSLSLMDLVQFNNRGVLEFTFTNNFNLLKSKINSLFISSQNTNLGEGISKSYEDFLNLRSSNPSRESAQDYMIVVSDGETNMYIDSLGNLRICQLDLSKCRQYALDESQKAKNDNITVYTIGVGTIYSNNRQLLQSISSGSGYYFEATNPSDLESIYRQIALDICPEPKESQLEVWDDSDSQIIYVGEDNTFYANYSAVPTTSPGIPEGAIEGAECYLHFDDALSLPDVLMTFNSASELYEYTSSFGTPGTFEFSVECSHPDYETQNAEDTFTITEKTGDKLADLEIWDDSDSQIIYVGEDNSFYADYADELTGSAIEGATCLISFDEFPGEYSMSWDSSLEVYTYTDSFNQAGVFEFYVTCSHPDYESLSDSDEFIISEEGARESALQIWDDSDFETIYENEPITFHANYTDELTGDLILGSTCYLTFDDVLSLPDVLMTFNSASNLYEYTSSFGTPGVFDFSVECSHTGYETQNAEDTFTITENGQGGEESELQIWDDSNFEEIYVNENISFYANYTDALTNEVIEGANCLISFSQNPTPWQTMIFNPLNDLYEYTRQFSEAGIFNFTVNCSHPDYETQIKTDLFEISDDENETPADLKVWDDSDNKKVYINENITFYANYTDENTSAPIENAICNISFSNRNGSFIMTYGSGLYTYETSFSHAGTYNYYVTCSAEGYQTLNAEDKFVISSKGEGNHCTHCGASFKEFYSTECIPNWICSGWSECSDGFMTRSCYDENQCESAFGEQPSKSASCNLPGSLNAKEEKGKVSYLFLLLLISFALAVILLIILIAYFKR